MDYITRKGLLVCIAAVFIINLFVVEARAEKRIGVVLWSEEARYIESKNGILDQLKKDGFGEPAVKYTIENAKGSKLKIAEIAQKFAAAKMNLIITIGTSATVPTAKVIQHVPIIFSMVYDPVEAGIAKSWKSSGNNTTGASPRISMPSLVNALNEFAQVKKLGVLYTPGEKNSEIQLKELQRIQAGSKIKIDPVIIVNREEIAQTLAMVISTVDALYLTGSSVVGASVPLIVDIANKAKVATITHLDDLVQKGALLGVSANSYQVGRLAGKKAVKVLNGAKPSSIPIEFEEKVDVVINMKTAKAGQFQIPPEFMKKVTKIIE